MRRRVAVATVVSLAAAACGDDSPAADGPSSITTTTSTTTTTTEAPAAGQEATGDAIARVRMHGRVAQLTDGPLRLCASAGPSGCFRSVLLSAVGWDDVPGTTVDELWGSWSTAPLAAEGTLHADGTLVVDTLDLVPLPADDALPCPANTGDYPTVGGLSFDQIRGHIVDYTMSIVDVMGGHRQTDNRRGITIIRVTDDPAPHQAALDAIVPGRTCVIQVTNSQADLEALRNELHGFGDVWEERGYGWVDVSVDTELNLVTVSADRIDGRFWADLGDGADLALVGAFIDVLDGEMTVLDGVTFPSRAPERDRLYSACGRFPVSAGVFERAPVDHLDDHLSNAVFAQTALPEVPEPGDPTGWWRAYENPDVVLLVNEDMRALTVRRQFGEWVWSGSGGCRLGLADPLGLSIATWEIDPEVTPGPDEIAVPVWDSNCSSGQPPGDRIQTPVVEETDDAVTITILVEPPVGDQNCPGSPPSPFTVTLDAPLGDRTLFDGGQLPPRPVA